MTTTNTVNRFWSKVAKGPSDECWRWRGATFPNGYGVFSRSGPGMSRYAHRAAYEFASGPIPKGLLVRHLCHNRLCCNPAHLAIGTPADNAADTVAANRQTQGESHPRARLTERQVVEIRERYAGDHPTMADLAREYGVTRSTIHLITTGRNWPKAGGPISKDRTANKNRSVSGSRNPRAKLTEDDVREIRSRHAEGESKRSLARRFRVSPSQVHSVVTRRAWRSVA